MEITVCLHLLHLYKYMAAELLHCVKWSWYFKLQVLGMPPNDFVQSASRRRLFFGENLPSRSF